LVDEGNKTSLNPTRNGDLFAHYLWFSTNDVGLHLLRLTVLADRRGEWE